MRAPDFETLYQFDTSKRREIEAKNILRLLISPEAPYELLSSATYAHWDATFVLMSKLRSIDNELEEPK